MAKPTHKPRLSSIDPDRLALTIARLTLEHVGDVVARLLSPAYEAPQPIQKRQPLNDALRETVVYKKVHELVRFAVEGGELVGTVSEYLQSCEWLYQSVLGEPAELQERVRGLLDRMSRADADTELGIVISGALARERLAEGLKPLTSAELAVLSGLSRRQMQQLLSSGELEHDDGRVASAAARRWLAERGVAGLEAKVSRRKP